MTINISEILKNWVFYMPEIFLGISIVLLLGYGVIYSKIGGVVGELKKITNLSILTLILTIYLEYNIQLREVEELSTNINVLGLDKITQLMKIVIMISSIIVLIMSLEVYKNKLEKIVDYEYTQLILLSTLGMLLLISSRDIIMMYLSIETVSLSLYILAAIRKSGQLSTEAGLKYFVLGALSSGLLLFGCALLYITTGMINYNDISNYINGYNNESLMGIEVGIIFIIFAILFKLAAAPFHM
jgi:NADH-quinone oxidoreductase subunit N